MKKILGLAVVIALWMAPAWADMPKAQQVQMMQQISEHPEGEWPRMLHDRRASIDTNIIQYIGQRSMTALDQIDDHKNHPDADHDAFFFALLADEAAKEVHQPIIWRLQLADGYFKKGLAAQAYDILDNICVSDPRMPEPYMLGGNFLLQIKNYEEARTKFEKVLKLSPRSEGALEGIAKIDCAEHMDLAKAKASVHRLRLMYPNNDVGKQLQAELDNVKPMGTQPIPSTGYVPPVEAVTLYDQAREELYAGQLSDALTTTQAAVAKAPQYADAQALLGDILMRQSKYPDAAAAYEKAAALTPEKAESFRYEGFAYEMAYGQSKKPEDLDKAIAAYQEAVRLKSDNDQYKAELSRVLKLKG